MIFILISLLLLLARGVSRITTSFSATVASWRFGDNRILF